MRVAQLYTIAADKKEPLDALLARIRKGFLDAGLGEPAIRFTLMDSSRAGSSAIDRVVKRFPHMERFVSVEPLAPHFGGNRHLTNSTTGEAVDLDTFQAIAAGVPRSFGFNAVVIHFHAPIFGERLIGLPKFGNSLPGVMVTDNRWVSGRHRALSVYTVVEPSDEDTKLPPNPEPVDAVIKACGKVKKIEQVARLAPDGKTLVVSIPPANIEAVKAIVADYRARIKEVVQIADPPHDLSPPADARAQNAGVLAGPRKPALDAAFKPMGYACRGGSGTFHLTRRTPRHLTVELYLDVGTWSHSVSAIFMVLGAGFKASLGIPVAAQDTAYGQYPIGDADRWQKIVANLAAIVRELDRTFVPEIEQAAGPSPAWYQPQT